jgi:hypothetical protein
MRPPAVYLDSSILIAMCDGRAEDLRQYVEATVERGTHIYPFSADQVSEIAASDDHAQNAKRLDYLERLSFCTYFVNSVTEFGFKRESPRSVYATLSEVKIFPSVNKLFADCVSHDQQMQARQALGLDPNDLNNLDGVQAVAAIDEALRKRAPSDNAGAPTSLSQLISLTKTHVVTSFSDQWKRFGQNESDALRSYEILALFSMLDFFGYWPDDVKTYGKGSRFPDSQHTFNASYFDVLVSNDKRMRNRAQAVYEVLGIKTQVMSAVDFAKQKHDS